MKKEWEKLTAAARSVKRQSTHWLQDCLIRNAGTKYGLEYGFDGIRDEDDYRARVPLISYEDILPLIQDMSEGKADVLFAGNPVAFEKTGGSGGGEKIVPYSAESIRDFRNALLPWLASLSETYSLGT